MPSAKNRTAQDDARVDGSTVRERQIAAAAHARNSKKAASTNPSGTNLKEASLLNPELNGGVPSGSSTGMAWSSAPLKLLDTYRVAHHLNNPAAFTSPLHQALLTNPGIGRQSPTMARRKDKRRIAKDQLALSVRKHFNGAAVNEIDVVVELIYKIKNQDKSFRLRSSPNVAKKQT